MDGGVTLRKKLIIDLIAIRFVLPAGGDRETYDRDHQEMLQGRNVTGGSMLYRLVHRDSYKGTW